MCVTQAEGCAASFFTIHGAKNKMISSAGLLTWEESNIHFKFVNVRRNKAKTSVKYCNPRHRWNDFRSWTFGRGLRVVDNQAQQSVPPVELDAVTARGAPQATNIPSTTRLLIWPKTGSACTSPFHPEQRL